jgi:hypothetical protein
MNIRTEMIRVICEMNKEADLHELAKLETDDLAKLYVVCESTRRELNKERN